MDQLSGLDIISDRLSQGLMIFLVPTEQKLFSLEVKESASDYF